MQHPVKVDVISVLPAKLHCQSRRVRSTMYGLKSSEMMLNYSKRHYVSTCLSFCLRSYLPFCLFAYVFISLLCWSVIFFIYLCLSVCLPVSLYIALSIYLFVYLSLQLSVTMGLTRNSDNYVCFVFSLYIFLC